MRIRSRPENPIPNSANRSLVSEMIHDATKSSPILISIARLKPRLRAFAC